MIFQYISCYFLARSGLFLCQLLQLPIFHVRNASALMQENLRRVTTDQKSQLVFNNLRKNASSEQYQYMYIHNWTTAYVVFWIVHLCIGDYTFV